MSEIVGWSKLNEMLLDPDSRGRLIRMPEGVTPFALAKACWKEQERRIGEPWKVPTFSLYVAMREMILFIRYYFVGGVEWARDSAISVMEDSPGHYLYWILDERGKFSKASRILMDFVLRGEAKQIHRMPSKTKAEQLNLKGGFDEQSNEE